MRPVSALFLLLFTVSVEARADDAQPLIRPSGTVSTLAGRRAGRAVGHRPSFNVPAADEAAERALARGVPGLTIVIRKGDATFSRAYGFADREANVEASIHHEWQVGSVTKQFTAAAVMRLVEAGVLHLGDRARQWLPELDARFDAITIEHLLTHTSGIGEYSDKLTTAWEPLTQQQIVAMINAQPVWFAPGTHFLYSNSGYFLLGMILERASSKTYAQLLDDLFFEPLGINRTSVCGTRTPSPNGYFLSAEGAFRVQAADMSLLFSAGAICSTPNDLVRWTHALANGTAVSPESYARMTANTDPTLGPPSGYGYGLVVTPLDGRRRVWHNGHVLGFQSHVAYFPDEQLTIAVLVNVSDLLADQATVVAEEVARAMRQLP